MSRDPFKIKGEGVCLFNLSEVLWWKIFDKSDKVVLIIDDLNFSRCNSK